jgi:hypothetical protein
VEGGNIMGGGDMFFGPKFRALLISELIFWGLIRIRIIVEVVTPVGLSSKIFISAL